MNAIILAAGYGTRLHPLTKDFPKTLLEISGNPILNCILDKIMEIRDIKKTFIVTNDKFFQKFIEWNSNHAYRNIKILNDGSTSESDRKGAIGDIDFAIKQEGIDDDIMVIAGDNLFEFSLTHLYSFFKEKKSSVIALHDIIDKGIASRKLGVVDIDGGSRIVGFEEKPEFPKTSLVSTACYILARKDVMLLEQCIREHKQPDNLGDFIKWLSAREYVYGYVFSERWFDIGTIEQFEAASREFEK